MPGCQSDLRRAKQIQLLLRPYAAHIKKEIHMYNHLDELEAQGIYIFREAYRRVENLAMLLFHR